MVRAGVVVLALVPCAAFWGRTQKPEVPEGGLACDGGFTAVSRSRVDDDYCDCADGADEPGTAACSGVTVGVSTFVCANAGYESARITASRVRDGTCDCAEPASARRRRACVATTRAQAATGATRPAASAGTGASRSTP